MVVAPLLALLVGLVASVAIIHRLGETRLIILVGILLMMSQHQALELMEFLRSGAFTEPFVPELVETAANLLTAGSVYYVLSFLQSERELTDELERSRKRYSDLIRNAPAPIIVQQGERIEYVNPAGANLFGAEADALVGRDLSEFVVEDDRATVERLLDRTRGDREPSTYRFRLADADGDTRHIEGHARGIVYEGEPAIQAFLHDRTEREAYESRLNQANERLETIFQNVNDAIVIIDEERDEVVECNRSACELLGYQRHELVGLSPWKIHPHERDRFERFLRDTRRDRQGSYELSCRRKDGRTVPVEVSATTVELEGRERILAVIRDVSERKKRERWGRILDRTLRHNLRTKINVIAGFADELGHEVDDDRLSDRATRIRDESMRLVEIGDRIRQLRRTITRSEAEGTTDLVVVVRSLAEDIRSEHPEADVGVELPEPPTVPANELIEQALRELIENAVEHNDAATPSVEVRVNRAPSDEATSDDPATYTVEIADNGPGIPEQDRDVVNRDTEITALRHGSGLGLWLAAWSVEAVGGSIRIEDGDRSGTVVRLRLSRGRSRPEGATSDLQVVGGS
ncbi:MAG: PAS domain S-box protein [Haloarculaceae archaeon]